MLTKLLPLPPLLFSIEPPSIVMLLALERLPAMLNDAPPEKPCTSAVPGLSTTPGDSGGDRHRLRHFAHRQRDRTDRQILIRSQLDIRALRGLEASMLETQPVDA